jgi:hypothetical protein
MEQREKIGKIYTDLKAKQQDKVDVFEFIKETQQDFMPSLVRLVEADKLKTNKDFYVEVCFRKNHLMPDIIETYMKSRHTCPTPFYDRSVFHYSRARDALFFLWHVPSVEECTYYIDNLLKLREDEKEAAKMVMDFRDGTLLRMAKTLNNEINQDELIFYKKDSNGREITS